MKLLDKLMNLDSIFGIWNYSKRIRVTFVRKKWLIVWDHTSSPPVRHDFERDTHHKTCRAAMKKVRALAS